MAIPGLSSLAYDILCKQPSSLHGAESSLATRTDCRWNEGTGNAEYRSRSWSLINALAWLAQSTR